jgi:hypothetical protein
MSVAVTGTPVPLDRPKGSAMRGESREAAAETRRPATLEIRHNVIFSWP